MSTINQINTNSPPAMTAETSSQRTAAGNGALATIDSLIAMLQKMNGDIRDMQREHYSCQQKAAHQKDLTALATKQKAIDLNHTAARGNAAAKVFSGVLGIGGSVTSGISSSMGRVAADGLGGLGKIGEGSAAWIGAGKTREAQEMQAIGDFQSTAASDYWKSLSATADKASEASRRMLEMTRELMSLQERIMSAVRM